MFTVDCQSHVFPKEFADLLTKNSGWVRAEPATDGYQIQYGSIQTFQLSLAAYDIDKKIIDMDKSGVDVSVLSVNMPGPEVLDADKALQGARSCNNFVAEVCAKHSQRFIGLGVLPLQLSSEIYLEEYRRAIHDLGLRGIVLYSHIAGKGVDASEMEPLYTAAETDGIPLVIHPTVPTWGEVIKEYSMIPMLGLMVDHSIAMLKLILGGVLERHPNLKVVHPHCGGVLPYLMPRIEEQTEVKGRGREHIRRPPGEYYRNVYLDLVSPSPLPMEYVLRFAPPDHLLFGSDHPWVRIEVFKEMILGLGIPEKTKRMILGENARTLFRF